MKNKFERFYTTSNTGSFLIALLVGLGTGIGAVIFRYLITFFEFVGYSWIPTTFPALGNLTVVIVPAVGGLIVGLLIYNFAQEAKGHGVPEVMEAVALHGGKIRPVVALIKSLASAISIGSGGSVGREGPIVQIGSSIGSTLGQKLHLSDEKIRILVACGAAGGIAATFNAPIAGVIFALEIIVGEFSVRHFSLVVISSVASSIVGQAVFGDIPAFLIPVEYGITSLWEFSFFPVLSVLAALLGVLFVKSLYWAEDLFSDWKGVPEWLKPMIGGILLGGLALLYPILTGIHWEGQPQIFNVGYDVIEDALAGNLVLGVALAFLFMKLLATILTLGSGGSGGVFAPSLFMGAMLGTVFELGVRKIFPSIIAPPGAYALIGMAATFTAAAHAPITAVIILFELTGDYRIIMPLMLTVVITTIISQQLLKGESIYTLKLSRRGVHLSRGRDVDILEGVLVKEVMSHDFTVISMNDNLSNLSILLNQTSSHGVVVLDDDGKLFGIVTVSDLRNAISSNSNLGETKVKDVATKRADLLITYPNETIGQALYRMGSRGLGRLPVISREDPGQILGLIRRQNIIRAYHLALTRRSEITHKIKQLELETEDDFEVIHLLVNEESAISGKKVSEIARLLPEDSLLVSIKQDGRGVIPHGSTLISPNDFLTIIVNGDDVEDLKGIIK
ncbi:MAG: chloride channel protein [Anaerolineales bacterium]|nr:chloride channel protein [Anaerolineales bacterium]